MNQVMVQLKFTENTPNGQYSDALYFTQDEYASLKPEEIEALKQTRIDNWINIIKNPPALVEPTKDELIAQAEDLQKQIDDIQLKILEKG